MNARSLLPLSRAAFSVRILLTFFSITYVYTVAGRNREKRLWGSGDFPRLMFSPRPVQMIQKRDTALRIVELTRGSARLKNTTFLVALWGVQENLSKRAEPSRLVFLWHFTSLWPSRSRISRSSQFFSISCFAVIIIVLVNRINKVYYGYTLSWICCAYFPKYDIFFLL